MCVPQAGAGPQQDQAIALPKPLPFFLLRQFRFPDGMVRGSIMNEKKENGFVFVTRLGFELVVTTFACAGVGYYFDSRFGMRYFPILSIVGLLLGGGAGFWMVYRTISRMTRPEDGDRNPDKRE